MSIFDIFKSTPAPAQQVPNQGAPANQGNIPAAPTVATNPDGTPAVAAAPEVKDESPLAEFNNLWENAPVDVNNPVESDAYVPPSADEIQKAVAKADFSKQFTQEQLDAVTSGGEGAQAALVSMLNSLGQQSLAQSTMVSSKLNEQAMKAAIAAEVAKMPGLVRAQSASAHLKDTNPLFDNPAIKPVIEATQAQLQTKFPNATPAELTKMTQAYITSMGAAFAPKPEVAVGIANDDWSDYLEKGH